MIRILTVEDHDLVRASLNELLERQHDMRIAGTAANGQEAVELLINGLKVDVVLADLRMPLMGGILLTQDIRAIRKNCRIIILTMYKSDMVRQQVMDAGASDCLYKDGDLNILLDSIRHISNPVKIPSSGVTNKI